MSFSCFVDFWYQIFYLHSQIMTEKIAAIGREFLYAATTVSAHPHTSGCIFFFLVPINVDELTLLPCEAFASTRVQPSCISKNYCPSNLSFSVLYYQFLSSGSLLALKKCYLFYIFKIKKAISWFHLSLLLLPVFLLSVSSKTSWKSFYLLSVLFLLFSLTATPLKLFLLRLPVTSMPL